MTFQREVRKNPPPACQFQNENLGRVENSIRGLGLDIGLNPGQLTCGRTRSAPHKVNETHWMIRTLLLMI